MVTDTRKASHMQFYKPRSIARGDWASRYIGPHVNSIIARNIDFEVARQLGVPIKTRTDFIIADMEKGSFEVVEIKKSVGQADARQISPYLRMPVIAGGHYILPAETEVGQGGIFVLEGIETLPELIKTARPIEISYLNRVAVETLLGSQGKRVLEKLLSLVKGSAAELHWSLERVKIRYVRDLEVKDWDYILLLLVFTCDFDTADRHLHQLYDQIDTLTGKLSDEEQEVLRRMIFFDIETEAAISSD